VSAFASLNDRELRALIVECLRPLFVEETYYVVQPELPMREMTEDERAERDGILRRRQQVRRT